MQAFAPTWRTIAYDLRGFGLSDAPPEPGAYAQDKSVADLAGLLDALHITRAAVCGLSMGGNIALHFGLNHPERTAGLVIVDTAAGSDDPAAFARTTTAWADVAEREGINAFARTITENPIFAEYAERGPKERRYMQETILANTVQGVANTARQVLAVRPPVYALEARLEKLAVPTLLIVGEHDTACLPPARYMARTIPGARLEVISGTGHFNNLEAPEAFNTAVASFLARLEV
jgi:pimeloyl-ACP methyl ester carboxylesterase